MKDKQLIVTAIKEGTVIDHIPSESLFNVIAILGLDQLNTLITFGNSLESKKLGKKGIIKVSDVFFSTEEINKIALIAPTAKLNIIREFEVVEKVKVEIPDRVEGIIKCVNPKCITNHEVVFTKFTVVSKEPIKLKCHYCEKITSRQNLDMI
ncbi:MAG: aspartate carbamoyltransferase regulatory subunit [Bacteroidales bacterium]|nr:aspartate carbamoyltransferase regulatory subunit [Bacteroidales bacterium]MDT8431705.1 aspartate carbamoyltransferase regulatory subunit [Bacteroidales bacterium]